MLLCSYLCKFIRVVRTGIKDCRDNSEEYNYQDVDKLKVFKPQHVNLSDKTFLTHPPDNG